MRLLPPSAVLLGTLTLVVADSAVSPAFAGGMRQPTSAAQFGVLLVSDQDRLLVGRVAGPLATLGLRVGDQIIAVNGRRVATERAFVGRLSASMSGGAGANIVVARNGATITISSAQSVAIGNNAPPSSTSSSTPTSSKNASGGFINPANMVVTKDGRVMHKAVAARLGLEGHPLQGSTAPPGAEN